MSTKIYSTIAALIVCIAFIADHAGAEKTQVTTLDTLTVTANKQKEDIQDVPIGITAFDGLTLEDKNISSLTEMADFVPNLAIIGTNISASNLPVMRGIMAEMGTMSVATPIFVDGIPILSFSGYEDTLQNIERVEVLRGPQGTLYGKNAVAGAINIITRQPSNEFEGKVSAAGGEDYKKELSFNMNGPVVQDKLFFGLAGQYYEKDGFIKNGNTGGDENDKGRWYGKGLLNWKPVGNLSIQLILSHLQYDSKGPDIGLSEIGAAAFGLPASGDREVYCGSDAEDNSESNTQSLNISYDFGETLNLTSTTTHRKFETDVTFDYDFNPIAMMDTWSTMDNSKLSQELKLSSAMARINWVTGFYYDKDDDLLRVATTSVFPTMNSVNASDSGGEGYAVFGQLRYALTDRMGVTGGLRYEHQDKDIEYNTGLSLNDSWEDVSPKFSLDYSFTQEVMGYATIAKGVLTGGFNAHGAITGNETYDEQELWSYEVGGKAQLFDNKLIVNGALFYMDIDDMQVTEWVTTPYGPATQINNAATATSYGAELEIQAKITSQFTLAGSFGCANAEFDEFQDAMGDYSDNKAPNAPEYTFSIGGDYRMGNGFFVGVDVVGYGKMYGDSANTYKRDAYQLLNAKVGYEADSWDVYLYGKNISDEDYTWDGLEYWKLYSEPREMGLKLAYRF
jgi:iron complex outermembrane receptor protein